MNYLIYDKVVALCDEKGISQRKLQRDLGLSSSAVSRWRFSAPRAETLQAVANYFDVTVEFLTGVSIYRNREHMLQSFDENVNIDELVNGSTDVPYDMCEETDEGIVLRQVPRYIDPRTREIAERLMDNERLHHLFDIITNLSDARFNVLYGMLCEFFDEK